MPHAGYTSLASAHVSRVVTETPAKEQPKSMEQPKDEEIVCASCGVTFVFSAEAAAARAERGITTPPTMCKPCWREKASNNERRGADGSPRTASRHGRPQRNPNQAGGWGGRSTGDVNEYRSPMPDPHFAGAGQAPRGWSVKPAFSRRGPSNDGNYRAPSFHNDKRSGAPRPNRERSTDGRNPGGSGRPRNRTSTDITCAACGVAATVPFKPAEGQKVYCRTCFQAEKPT
jgi:CxxC-x17-CxxC domain-containing protein